jgi:serine/threonine protein kinase/WD40 repeat protein
MTANEEGRNPVEKLAEAFLERYRRGERPSIAEYTAQYPEVADQIRHLFPALAMMEELAPAEDDEADAGRAAVTRGGQPLERIGDYRIFREIGRGGMGIVYEAEQEALGRHVALKVLPYQAAADPVLLKRFRREARSAARLHHTNIVPIFDVGEHAGMPYYAMQFIEGQGLDEVLRELKRMRGKSTEPAPAHPDSNRRLVVSLAGSLIEGQFGPNLIGEPRTASLATADGGERANSPAAAGRTPATGRDNRKDGGLEGSSSVLTSGSGFSTQSDFHFYRGVARIGLQVADALKYAHSQKVLHRDIKPSNLILDVQGTVWITDFGLAKDDSEDLTRTGDLVGTLRYMAPERFNGLADARSDIYGLGLTLYELLTMRAAFDAADREVLIKQIIKEEPPKPRRLCPHLPRDLETIVQKAIEKEPARRYSAAADMAEDLRRFLADRPIRARPATVWEQLWRLCRRNPLPAALAATVMLLIVSAAVVSTLFALSLKAQRDRADAAESAARLELGKHLLGQGAANQHTGTIGRRFESLNLLRQAGDNLRAHPGGAEYLPEVRDQVISALALTDVKHQNQIGFGIRTCIAVNQNLDRYAISDLRKYTLDISSTNAKRPYFHLPFLGRRVWFVDTTFSHDGEYAALVFALFDNPSGVLEIWHLKSKTKVFSQAVGGHQAFFSADGRSVWFLSAINEIVLWDLERNRCQRRFTVSFEPVTYSLSPDGRKLAVSGRTPAGQGALEIFDVDTGFSRPMADATDRQDGGDKFICWSPDGQLLVRASCSGRVYIHDAASSRLTAVLHGHSGAVISCQCANKRPFLATSSWDGTTRLWNVFSGECLLTFQGGFYGFSDDDAQIAVANRVNLDWYEFAHDRECLELIPGGSHSLTRRAHVKAADFSADGRLLAIGDDQGVRIYDAANRSEVGQLCVPQCAAVLFYDNGAGPALITDGVEGVRRWPMRLSNGHGVETCKFGSPETMSPGTPSEEWYKASFLPGHRSLAILDNLNARLSIVDIDHTRAAALAGSHHRMTSIAISPDGKWAAAGGWKERNILVWNLEHRTLHLLPRPPEWQTTVSTFVSFTPDGGWLIASTYADNEVNQGYYFFSVPDWKLKKIVPATGGLPNAGPAVFSADGKVTALHVSRHQIRLLDSASGRTIAHLSTLADDCPRPLAFSPDGSRLVASTIHDTVLVWDLTRLRTELDKLGLADDWPPHLGSANGRTSPEANGSKLK